MKAKILQLLANGKYQNIGRIAAALGEDPYAVRMTIEGMHRAGDVKHRFDGGFCLVIYKCVDCGEEDRRLFHNAKPSVRCAKCKNINKTVRYARDKYRKKEFEL